MPPRHLPILLALSLLGCPTTQPIDAGEDAFSLDATDHHDGGADANDQDATDRRDAGVDASRPDAFVCNCDDGIACTSDSCDARGQCVHVSSCADGEACRWGDAGEGCVATDACVDRSGCPDLPCQPSLGCWRGRCRYEWDDDLDGDGVGSNECGGPDCDPLDPTIPRGETCNGVVPPIP